MKISDGSQRHPAFFLWPFPTCRSSISFVHANCNYCLKRQSASTLWTKLWHWGKNTVCVKYIPEMSFLKSKMSSTVPKMMCNNIDDVLTIPNVSYRVWTGAAAYALWYIMYHNIISKSYTEILMHITSQCLIEKHSNIPKLGMYGIYKIDCILTFPHISFTK